MRTVPQQYLSKYSNKNDVSKQANAVLSAYPGLNLSMEKFYFANGSSKDLICMKGTIPIKFQGSTYNIPVSIHLPEHYPQKAPIVYVTPTSSMAVRPSKTVDPNGLVKLPYISNWSSRTHSLVNSVQAMVHEFSMSPPVYAKTQQPAPQMQQTPYPSNYGNYPYSQTPPYPTPGHHPPYGPAAGNPPYPVGGMDANRRASGQISEPPPYSGHPNHAHPHPPTSDPSTTPYPMNPPAYMPQAYNSPGQPPITQPSNTHNYGSSNNAASMDPIKASLLTAITETLSRRIQGAQEMAQKDLDKLTQVQGQLKSNRDQLEMTVSQLEQQIAVANSHVDLLSQKKSEVEGAIQQVQIKSEITDIDDCITPSCPLYKQLLNLYAEECAIEDTTYYLDKALMDNIVDLETYLKNVRVLSRKQFMVRAQMQKARQAAGLKNITPH